MIAQATAPLHKRAWYKGQTELQWTRGGDICFYWLQVIIPLWPFTPHMEVSVGPAEDWFIMSNCLSIPLYLFVDRYLCLHEYKVGSKMLPSRNRSSMRSSQRCVHARAHTFNYQRSCHSSHSKKTSKYLKNVIKDGTNHVTCQNLEILRDSGGCWKLSGLLKQFWKAWLQQQEAWHQCSPTFSCWSHVSRILQHQSSHLMLQNDRCLWQCLTF